MSNDFFGLVGLVTCHHHWQLSKLKLWLGGEPLVGNIAIGKRKGGQATS